MSWVQVGVRAAGAANKAANTDNPYCGAKATVFGTGSVAFSVGYGLWVGTVTTPILTPVGGLIAGVAAGFVAEKAYGDAFAPENPSDSGCPSNLPDLPPHGPWTPPGQFPDPHPDLSLGDELPLNGSPLILDLDGDGVEAGAAVFFDHEGDGFMELTRWVGEGDGMLVWDRNGDGVINDGSELFGNNTVLANGEKAAHGFVALAELDSNGDGVVNSQDENFSDLRVMRWTDANENGTKSLFLM